jgi:lipopolysaccharide transport system ATP-binding protein
VTSHPAIRVSGLSKLYKVGARQQGYKTLRESIADACAAPFARLRGRSAAKRRAESGKPSASASPAPSASNTATSTSTSSPRLSGEQFWALKDVSFEVQPGEVVGIIGRNGAGKSTLLKILSRITEPTSGRIELRGRVGSLLEVGTGFHPELSGRENIYMNGSILGMSRREIQRKFDEIVDFSGIEDFLDTPVKRYSSGMYVRLAFAVAAHLEPEILIVDEVLAVGDAAFQRRCMNKMREVGRRGTTVLFVSHNFGPIVQLCTAGVSLEGGRIKDVGTIQFVVGKYLSDTTSASCDYFDLRSHPGRAPRSIPMLQELGFCSNGKPVHSVGTGEELTLKAAFDSVKSLDHACLGVVIKDGLGAPLIPINNKFLPSYPDNGSVTHGVLDCVIDSLPLIPGTYHVDLYFGDRSQDYDVISNAGSFEVHDTNYYQTGKLPPNGYGSVAVRATWKWSNRSQIA